MVTMNITLPDSLGDWVNAQVQKGQYASSSDYLRELIGRDQENHLQQQALQLAITEGINSGVSELSMQDLANEARKRLTSQ